MTVSSEGLSVCGAWPSHTAQAVRRLVPGEVSWHCIHLCNGPCETRVHTHVCMHTHLCSAALFEEKPSLSSAGFFIHPERRRVEILGCETSCRRSLPSLRPRWGDAAMGRAARPALPVGKASLGTALAGAGRATLLGAAPSITRLRHRHQRDPMPRPAGGQGKLQWSQGSPEKAMGARGHGWGPSSPRVGTARLPWDEVLPG